jgi:DNA repair protein RadA/Sms
MAKVKTVFYCQNCGAQASKWIGRCPSCEQWNTYVEEIVQPASAEKAWKKISVGPGKNGRIAAKAQSIDSISVADDHRITIADAEMQRVLGGGIVPGSITLIGGEPGIGKSTLMLQLALQMNSGRPLLYVSGEESAQQIKLRANRINPQNKQLMILTETSLENIFTQVAETDPSLLIIDSIQTVFTDKIESSPGSVSQIRECAAELLRYAKETSVPVFIIGHITKEGTIAGPKVLEHMVDTVLQFEGDRHHVYRILRAAKNRFGSTAELGIYEMAGDGLRQVSILT